MSSGMAVVYLPAVAPESRCLARISSRSALYGDLSQLLNSAGDDSDYRRLVVEENVCLRKTASARQKLYQELKGRYLLDPEKAEFKAFLTEWSRADGDTDRKMLAYVLFCMNDKTVYSTSVEWLFPRVYAAPLMLSTQDLTDFFNRLGKSAAPEISAWTTNTLQRVVQHYLASVRDFGFAEGKHKKLSVRPNVTAPPTRLLLRLLKLAGVADKDAISHPAFRIFGIAESQVYDHLRDLHQQRGLHFKMQADVIELGGFS